MWIQGQYTWKCNIEFFWCCNNLNKNIIKWPMWVWWWENLCPKWPWVDQKIQKHFQMNTTYIWKHHKTIEHLKVELNSIYLNSPTQFKCTHCIFYWHLEGLGFLQPIQPTLKNVFLLLKCIEFNMTKKYVVALGFNKNNSENYSTLLIQ